MVTYNLSTTLGACDGNPWETVIDDANKCQQEESTSPCQLTTLYVTAIYLLHLLYLFDSRYESLTFRVLPVVIQLRTARLHNPDGNKFNRSSVYQATREVRICGFHLFAFSRKPTEILRIPKRRWKDHEVTQVCCPCPPCTLYQHCPW